MKIKRIISGNLESNGYIIYQREGGDAYIIDPGYNPKRFLKALEERNLNLVGILLTHHHYDHVGAVDVLQNETGCSVYLNAGDQDIYGKPVTGDLAGDTSIFLEDEEIRVLNTPGHTYGGVCLYSEKSKLAFTGDTIFNVDLGRTDLEDGSDEMMKDSIRNIISKWGNDITIYPGHGDPATMKYVRTHNQEYLDIVKE